VPRARNALDRTEIFFEDEGGEGTPVVLYGGILDTVELVRGSELARALQQLAGEFRLVYADHRGLGRSEKPHRVDAYAMRLQAADAVAVLDARDIERAHFVGRSYGGRLVFGLAEHAPERVLSLVAGGQQPYALDRGTPLWRVIANVLEETRQVGVRVFVETLEAFWETRFPEPERTGYLAQDGAAVAAAAEAMLKEGDISSDLSRWKMPFLIYLGAGDVDFFEQARRAAQKIPNASFVALEALDHYGAHYEAERVIPAVLETLRTEPAIQPS
jgi:pimeloyl-ACP methyl ester carboxylesterase